MTQTFKELRQLEQQEQKRLTRKEGVFTGSFPNDVNTGKNNRSLFRPAIPESHPSAKRYGKDGAFETYIAQNMC